VHAARDFVGGFPRGALLHNWSQQVRNRTEAKCIVDDIHERGQARHLREIDFELVAARSSHSWLTQNGRALGEERGRSAQTSLRGGSLERVLKKSRPQGRNARIKEACVITSIGKRDETGEPDNPSDARPKGGATVRHPPAQCDAVMWRTPWRTVGVLPLQCQS